MNENGPDSAEGPPTYSNAVERADSIIYGIGAMEVMDEDRDRRSSAPSPESLKEVGHDV